MGFLLRNENKERTKEGQGRLSAIHSDYRRYLGVNISIPNQPTTPLQPINQNTNTKENTNTNLYLYKYILA